MSTLVTLNQNELITSSRADINGNFSALNAEKIETSVLDTDTTLAANSDSKVATQKAVKAYVDAGGNVNASETNKGIVEEATDAEVTAGTATGGTGAKLFVSPAKLATRLATAPIVTKYLTADSPATWTKPSGLRYITVEVQAGGGGSGSGATVAGDRSAGAGAGGYSKKQILAASLGGTETVTIGAAGAGGSGGSDNATAGGNSSFGIHATTVGGAKSVPFATGNTPGDGGTASDGDLNIPGGSGYPFNTTCAGSGGDSVLGRGGKARTPTSMGNGNVGTGYGGGGGGMLRSGSDVLGGAGAPGIVIVTEYYV